MSTYLFLLSVIACFQRLSPPYPSTFLLPPSSRKLSNLMIRSPPPLYYVRPHSIIIARYKPLHGGLVEFIKKHPTDFR